MYQTKTKKGSVAAMLTGGIIGVGAFLAGIPGPLNSWVNPDLGLFYAHTLSLVVLIIVSKTDKNRLMLKKGGSILH
jgi:hypothetical protein